VAEKNLHVSDLEDLRRFLRAPNNLDWLLTLSCWFVRDLLLRAFPPPKSTAVTNDDVQRIGNEIYSAVLKKLKHHYPNDAQKGDSLLLRYRYRRAAAILIQAEAHTTALWEKDFTKYSRDSLAARCKRLLPKVGQLPGRGKPALGTTHLLLFLIFYEEALRALAGVPDMIRPFTEAARKDRQQSIRKAFDTLSPVSERDDNRFHHPETGQLYFEVEPDEINKWSELPKSKIAEDIAVRIVKGRRKLSRKYLHIILPKLRKIARALDRGLNMR
jgi:hypothetical protein